MNTEQMRKMIENLSIKTDSNVAECTHLKEKSNRVAELIERTFTEEFVDAWAAKDMVDYYVKMGDYVNKLYMALMAISNECWSAYISNVGLGAELRAKAFINEKYDHLEVDEVHPLSHLILIKKEFRDFVYTFFTLQYVMKKTCGVNLDIEK